MKKVFTLILTFVLIFSLSVPAFAGYGSVLAPTKSVEVTADAPAIVGGTVTIVSNADIESLPVEQQEAIAEAVEAVAEIVPEGAVVNFINFVDTGGEAGFAVIALEGDFTEVIAMLLVNGKWISIKVTDNGDGTYTFDIPCDGVLTIMTK